MEGLAETDMKAAMVYELRVRDFHEDLRHWNYPRLFKNEGFDAKKAEAQLPKFGGNKDQGETG